MADVYPHHLGVARQLKREVFSPRVLSLVMSLEGTMVLNADTVIHTHTETHTYTHTTGHTLVESTLLPCHFNEMKFWQGWQPEWGGRPWHFGTALGVLLKLLSRWRSFCSP